MNKSMIEIVKTNDKVVRKSKICNGVFSFIAHCICYDAAIIYMCT